MNFTAAGYLLLPVVPEMLLSVCAMILLMIGAYNGQRVTNTVTGLAIFFLVCTAAAIVVSPGGKVETFGGSFVLDDFARFLKLLTLLGSAVTLILSIEFLQDKSRGMFEFPILVLLSTVGMMILISAGDLIALYLGLELMSLALYVVAASHRDNAKSTEAGLKYFVLGALSSGMLLYGASLIYGFTGTVSFAGIATAAKSGNVGLMFGLVFLLAGLCFKVSAVPFHMWTPDVYEGAPTPVTAFFASAPKVAALAVFTRVTLTAFPEITQEWRQIVVFVSIASMALGSFAAIGQTNIKRLMAYSSIGHMGFALVGLAAGTAEGAQGVLVYIAIYVTMTLGTFSIILAMKRDGQAVETISDFRGALPHQPAAGVLLRDAAVLAGRRSAAGRLLREILRVHGGHQCRPVHAGRAGRARERGGRLLLSLHHQGDVLRRADRRDAADAHRAAHGARGRGPLQHPVRVLSLAAGVGGVGRREIAVLMAFALGPQAQSAGYRLVSFDSIGSTNEEGLARARAGEQGALWLVTDHQVSGRGRRNRAWISPRGNLAASVLEVIEIAPAQAATLGFAAGVALAEALRSFFVQAELKWPNDVLLRGAKLSGILLEAESLSQGRMAVVTGIGVNIVGAPQDVPYAAVSLKDAGFALSAQQVFARLSDCWAQAVLLWDQGRGMPNLRTKWLSLCRRRRRASEYPGRRAHDDRHVRDHR